ncbi:MAG: Mur ligase family protein [Thermoanaerobaculia bacterium]
MRYSPSDLFHLLRTPVGRSQLEEGLQHRAWPVYSRLARIHRERLRGRTRIVAVIGSYGKSTTATAVACALGLDPKKVSHRNAWSQLARAMLRLRPQDSYGVLEVGIDRTGQMAHYARLIRPDVVVVTSIGTEHHRSLVNLESTRNEKAEMLRILDARSLAVLNGDDDEVLRMADQTRARTVTYGFSESCDVVARSPRLHWPRGVTFSVEAAGRQIEVRTRLLGEPGVRAATAGIAVALGEGKPLQEAGARISSVGPSPGRLEVVPLANGAHLLRDDFKSGLETVDTALDVLAEIPAARKLIVIGDISEPPGSQGPIYRRLGQRIGKIASRVVVLGSHRRRYAAGAVDSGMPRELVINAGHDLVKAVDAIASDLRHGDVVLVKGRNTQRMERVSLALLGRTIGCDIPFCDAKLRCDACPQLESGWQGRRVVM